MNSPAIQDRSRPSLTMTAVGAVYLQGADGNWTSVDRRRRGGRRVHRQRETSQSKRLGMRVGTLNVEAITGKESWLN